MSFSGRMDLSINSLFFHKDHPKISMVVLFVFYVLIPYRCTMLAPKDANHSLTHIHFDKENFQGEANNWFDAEESDVPSLMKVLDLSN